MKQKKEYYAVRKGRKTGIYRTWDECKQQTSGYPGAQFKGFYTLEEAEEFMENSQSIEFDSNKPYAYVDGSFNIDTGEYGYGGFIKENGRVHMLQGVNRDERSSMRNVAGEIDGAMAAVTKAEALHLKELQIFYDYQGIESWATGEWKTNLEATEAYANFMQSPQRTVKISFHKVKGHTGVEGNEIADALAKEIVGVELTAKERKRIYDIEMECKEKLVFNSEDEAYQCGGIDVLYGEFEHCTIKGKPYILYDTKGDQLGSTINYASRVALNKILKEYNIPKTSVDKEKYDALVNELDSFLLSKIEDIEEIMGITFLGVYS